MSRRRLGLQGKWGHVVNSLQRIVPSYERASSIISLFADKRMRSEAVFFACRKGDLVLDLGSGPGTMSRLVLKAKGTPVALDVSRAMLAASGTENIVQGAFEYLPFRPQVFNAVVSGFALRDAHDLKQALAQLRMVLRRGGRFSFCDLGKPDSQLGALGVALYLRVAPGVIGLATAGRSGLRYGSIFDTYMLVLHNEDLARLLAVYFDSVHIHETQLGGSIVTKCALA